MVCSPPAGLPISTIMVVRQFVKFIALNLCVLKRQLLTVFVLVGFVLPSTLAYGQSSLSLQGRIVQPDGTALEDSAVEFRTQILSPNANECILYDESQTVDMTDSGGLFSLTLNSSASTRNDAHAWTFSDVLSNRTAFAVNATECASGTGTVTYTPTVGDERKVVIHFKSSSMSSWDTMP